MNADELIENFELLGNWEERYAYLIDLGKELPKFPDEARIEENKVRGCMSQVWLIGELEGNNPKRLVFQGDSDALIVKGLIALLLTLCSGQAPETILATDVQQIFKRLQLDNHISVNRRNGFFSMLERIQKLAQHATKNAG